MREVRIFFSKKDDAKFISHLDLMRCFTRAIIRAEIPITYTEGFNPRPYMNFAMPLSLGIEGLREVLDIRVDGDIGDEEIFSTLSETMPKDIKIIEVKPPVKKATAVAFSKYKVEISQSGMPTKAFNDAVVELSSRDELIVSKLGKQGKRKVVKYINLTEHLKELKVWASNEGNSVLTFILPSNTQFGINPNLFTNKIFEEIGISPDCVYITRKYMLCEDGSKFE